MERLKASILIVSVVALLFLGVGSALNDEGMALLRFKQGIEIDPDGSLSNWEAKEGEIDPCLWNGVGCEHGRVVSLVLEKHCLEGILSAELGKLIHLKYLILHNNSLYGTVPREIGGLMNLEILDLGYNNLTGPLPSDLGNLLYLEILVVRGNSLIYTLPADLFSLELNGGVYVRGSPLSLGRRYFSRFGRNATLRRRILDKSSPIQRLSHAAPAPASSPDSDSPAPASSSPPTATFSDVPAPPSRGGYSPTSSVTSTEKRENTGVFVAIGLVAAIIVLAVIFIFIRVKNVAAVKPWVTGLSGQLRHALKTGAPALRRAELETACEDFSNIIGSLVDGKLYKGTLSNGVEIAVSVFMPDSSWSKPSEAQFRKKIGILSRVNHKNFVNLLGYCEEDMPFTRMMVFEYAPNGTLFEHLHLRGSQDLNWVARLRIAMGVAYCIDHMHKLTPPIVLKNLNSNMIHLTDDFAAKVADLELRSEMTEYVVDPDASWSGVPDDVSIVLKFGILLLELVSGKPPYSEEDGGLVNWANDYLKGLKPLKHMVDPSLDSFIELDVTKVVNVAKACLNPDPRERLSMKEVVRSLRDITSITPEAAAPRLSPLWWAELEIISSEE